MYGFDETSKSIGEYHIQSTGTVEDIQTGASEDRLPFISANAKYRKHKNYYRNKNYLFKFQKCEQKTRIMINLFKIIRYEQVNK